jgi:outer membrane protein, heavy metal efflux system
MIAAIAAFSGCAGLETERRSAVIAPPPLTAPPPIFPAGGDEPPPQPGGKLTLDEAIALALARNPDLASAVWNVEAGGARVAQAGLRPNPLASLTVEDVAGTGMRSGGEQAETTLRIAQPLELGGKRSARVNEASRGRDLTAWQYEQLRLDVVTATTRAFIAVLGAQERLALTDQTVQLGEQVVTSVSRLVDAGREPSAEATRAEVALAASRIDRAQAQRDLDTARQGLAALWGGAVGFNRAEGRLDEREVLPPLEDLAPLLPRNPDLTRWATELAQRQAAVELEEANAIPNLTLEAGYRRFEDNGDSGFVFGAYFPLPILNRNQGAIAEALHQVAAAKEAQRAAEVRARTALTQTYTELATAHREVAALRQTILPAATRAFESVNGGYLEGRYRYLDVLDAQRTLIANRERLVRALTDYRQGLARLERLTGGPIDPQSGTGEPVR